MSMTSRDAILQRIRTALSRGPQVEPPPVPEVWPRQNADPAALADRFESELKAVHGEVLRLSTIGDAQKQLAQMAAQSRWTSIGVMYRPICCDAVKV